MRDRANEIEMMGSQYFQCLTTSHSGWSFNHGDKVLWASKFFYLIFIKRWSEPWELFMVLKSDSSTAVRTVLCFLCIEWFWWLKEPCLWEVSGYLGRTVWSNPSLKTMFSKKKRGKLKSFLYHPLTFSLSHHFQSIHFSTPSTKVTLTLCLVGVKIGRMKNRGGK